MSETLAHGSDQLSIGTVLDLSLRNIVFLKSYPVRSNRYYGFNALLPYISSTPTVFLIPEVLDINGTKLISMLLFAVHTFAFQLRPKARATPGFDGYKSMC